MGMIPSRREDRDLTPLRLRAWISVSAGANACRKYAANTCLMLFKVYNQIKTLKYISKQ